MKPVAAAAALPVLLLLLAGCEVVPVAPAPAPYPPPVAYPSPAPPDYRYQEIQQCRADNRRAHAEVLDSYERARAAGRINPVEAAQFAAMEGRLRDLRIQLGRDGLNLQECQTIRGEIERVRNEVARMARYDPALAHCMADNRRAHQEVYALYDNARRSGRITPGEAQRFAAMDARLNAIRSDMERPGIILPECQRIGGAIARERDEVIRMTRSDPGVRQCMANNWRTREDIYRIYNEALRTGRIDVNEAQRFKQMEARLQGFQAELQRDGLTMDDCNRIGNALARERGAVEAMARY
jgi:hypothetical protein